MKKNYKYLLKEGLTIEFEINDWAQKADISLLTKCRDTIVLTTAVVGEKQENLETASLTVDYEEKFYAAGKIYGSRFIRREGKPSETAILNSRVIDRSLRPTLKNFPFEIQIVNTILALDPEIDPDVLAFLGSSLAFGLLGYEWSGPVGIVKISKIGNDFILFPYESEKPFMEFSMTIGGTKNLINMIELEGKEAKEEDIIKACEIVLKELNKINIFLESVIKDNIKEFIEFEKRTDYLREGEDFLKKHNLDVEEILFSNKEGSGFDTIFEFVKDLDEEKRNKVLKGMFEIIRKIFVNKIITEKIRPDGRKLDEIRSLSLEIDVLPRTHGSALFKRGLTHTLSTVTLAPLGEELWIREIEFEGFKRFMHHYNFPPYCVGEIGPFKAPSRREIGHGNLVEKSLKNLIPPEEEFPYTIRIVSDVLSSNGSTSMASVCSSSLALFDAGVPLKKHVAGISVGLAFKDYENYELLTDIQGPEDFWGGMDFKIAGTNEGITAIQLDVKIEGLNLEIIKETLEKAKGARNYILQEMKKTIAKPRSSLKEWVPKVGITKIAKEKIGLLIGPGGRNINEIIALTNSKIDIRPDGGIIVATDNETNLKEAIKLIKATTNSYEEGEIVEGRVIKILPFGAILDLGMERTGLLHISEIDNRRIENINKELKIGEILSVKIKKISDDGRIYLSLKDARKSS